MFTVGNWIVFILFFIYLLVYWYCWVLFVGSPLELINHWMGLNCIYYYSSFIYQLQHLPPPFSYIQGVFFIFCIFKRMSFPHPWPNFLFLSGMCSWDLTILYTTSIWLKSIHNMPWSTPEKMCLFLDKNWGIFNMCWNIMSDTDQTLYCWYTQIVHCYLYICWVFELFCA